MKLLFITPFYKPAHVYGGPTRSIPGLCEGLAQRGCEVEVMTTNANGEDKLNVETGQPIDQDGVPVTYFDQSTIRDQFFWSSDLRDACRRRVEEFDYVYVYGIWNYPAIAAGAACREKNVPYIISPRTGLMEWPLQQGWLRKKAYLWLFGYQYLEGAWAIHYTTEVEKRESEQLKFDVPGFVVPNCMDFSEFDQLPDAGYFRKRYGISEDAPLLLFLSRIEPRKGLELSFRAFARVRSNVPNAHFIVAGPGEEEYVQQLQELTVELGIGEATTFTGFVDAAERLEALVDANMFILTSYTENFAMAAVEAMASQTPVLLSEEVGVAKNADAVRAGISVPLEEDEITEYLGKVLSSPSLQEKMGRNGPSHVRSSYRPESVAEQMVQAIQQRREDSA
ncbi:glycosyltransferase [Salinibacter grassmerensis]|uniref:glycosyltransferase n=1 Tax=Salinibacter grassmerensis TaxID=3040353 RepID=UPI0021E88569|nr:glycosyltransferase [Salinibacter grassmerensis]